MNLHTATTQHLSTISTQVPITSKQVTIPFPLMYLNYDSYKLHYEPRRKSVLNSRNGKLIELQV